MRRILIATEGSSCSAEAIRRFATIFGDGPVELYVLAVVTPARSPSGGALVPAHYHREAESCQEALDLASVDLAMANMTALSLVRVGDPATVIVETARDLEADLIVLGTHGRQGLERLLKGSVAESVLRQATCGVFIFPYAASQADLAFSVGA